MCDLLFVPPFPFQRVANLSKSNRIKDRLQEDTRLSCLTTTIPVHDNNITTTLASCPLPSLNTTEHPSSTTAPSITDLPVGQQATGQEQQQLPSFQTMPQRFQMMEQPVFQKVVIVPTTALSSFQTMPQRFQMMEQPLFQRAVFVPTTALSSFQTVPQRFQMMKQPVFQRAVIVPTTALSSFQTMPQRFQMMEQPLFQRAVIVPTTALSLIFKQLEMKK